MAAAITVPDSQRYETITAAPPEAMAAIRRVWGESPSPRLL